ncbi:1690_t:CDS:1, partial [Racocetra persica]
YTEKGSMIGSKYLRVKLLDKNKYGDIRAFGKKKIDDIIEVVQPTVKKEKSKIQNQ